MTRYRLANSAAERYDRCIRYAPGRPLPSGQAAPQPTSAWPEENVALLERFRTWLLSSGTSPHTVDHVYIPMAGHALGLNLEHQCQLELEADLERAMDYVRAKRLGAERIDICRNALAKFRCFLRQERGTADVSLRPLNHQRYREGLPDWLLGELDRYQQSRQHRWRPARLNEQILRFWSGHVRLWRWLCERHTITGLQDVRRQYLLDYAGHQLAVGYAPSTVNQDLRYFHAFLCFLQEQDYPVPQTLLRLPGIKQPDRLPRFLTDEQVRLLRGDLEGRVAQATYPPQRRDALLDRAAFYLLWQGGMRLGEVEELRLDDLDLPGRKLMVRRGKGLKDRTVYLTDSTVRALHAYLAVRGLGPTNHVFLYRNQAVKKDLLRARIKAAGERVGVKVHPHRLRHTCATQLLNAGCRVTSIQRFLGHNRLNSTMIYARVHDRIVEEDYYAAMAHVEARLELELPQDSNLPLPAAERVRLLELAAHLAAPTLNVETRLDLVEQLRRVLAGLAPNPLPPANHHPLDPGLAAARAPC